MTLRDRQVGTERSGLTGLSLWPHQIAAVDMCRRYFASGSKKAALVQLPTGTGKTGIMAIISSQRARVKPVLVVCPSAALVDQLEQDFSVGFWEKVGAGEGWAPDVICQLLPSKLNDLLATFSKSKSKRVVVVGTVQALEQIRSRGEYSRLVNRFGTVLFDEGHREPAPEWAAAVRGLKCPTVLFSATPFRNDLKLFDVDLDFVSFLSFSKAVSRKLIRGVQIEEQSFGGLTKFVALAIATRDRLVKSGRFRSHDKMIVRAANATQVDELFDAFSKALRNRSDGVLALHDTFPRSGMKGREKRSDVPSDLRLRSERFLIHQNMLIEGIDDPSCTMLAVYDPFKSDRQLVQQIGRLTRLPLVQGKKVADAYVLARTGDNIDAMWKRFLEFDRACEEDGGPPVRRDTSTLDALVKALPSIDYLSGKFRTRLNLKADITKDLRLPRSALVFDVKRGFSLPAFRGEVSKALVDDDRHEIRATKIDKTCHCHISLKLKQTPLLDEGLFQAPSLEVTIYSLRGRRLFIYDSAGLWIDDARSLRGRVTPRSLRTLMPAGKDTVFSSVSMQNSDLGPLAVRGRRITGLSLEQSGAFLGEQTYVINQVAGRRDTRRRSLGFSRSRVRDGEGYSATPEDFSKWAGEISRELEVSGPEAPFFRRYAEPVETPKDTTPLNILIDLYSSEEEFVDADGQKVEFDFEEMCVGIEAVEGDDGYDHRFQIKLIDRGPADVWIKWDKRRQKYWLKSEVLSSLKLKTNDRLSLAHRLNQRQSFRVIPAGSKLIYAYGSFYDAALNLARPRGSGQLVLNLISAVPELKRTTSEKGDLRGNAASWPPQSVFGLIDRNLQPTSRRQLLGAPFPKLVCEDMGREVADFIAADDGVSDGDARAVFVAAKWSAGQPSVATSKLYDICAQVTKNLQYLKVDASSLPSAVGKYDRDWVLNGARVPRLRAGTTSRDFCGTFAQARENPISRRQTWMVLGGGLLSRRAVERAFSAKQPEPHVIQFYYLMLSTYSACQSVGVDLKIFCAD